jgi:hypothetical protein
MWVQARFCPVGMGLDNHMITDTVPVPRPEAAQTQDA